MMQPDLPDLLVYANDVEVGRLSIAQLKSIRSATRKDWRTYTSQGFNLLTVALNAVWRLFTAAPLVWFWLMALLAMFRPEGFREMLQTGMPSPEKAAQGLIISVHLAVFIAAIAVLAEAAVARNRFGFINYYAAGVNRRIRQLLELPIESALLVVHPRFSKNLPAVDAAQAHVVDSKK